MRFRCTFWYKIQVSSPVTSLFKKQFLSYRWKRKSHVETRSFVWNQNTHRLIYYILVRWLYFLEILVLSTISCTLYRKFSMSMALIKSVFVIVGRCLHQVKIITFKSLKPIADDHNSCSTIPVNSTNLVYNIICTITFFKTIKHNMPQMLFFLLFILM